MDRRDFVKALAAGTAIPLAGGIALAGSPSPKVELIEPTKVSEPKVIWPRPNDNFQEHRGCVVRRPFVSEHDHGSFCFRSYLARVGFNDERSETGLAFSCSRQVLEACASTIRLRVQHDKFCLQNYIEHSPLNILNAEVVDDFLAVDVAICNHQNSPGIMERIQRSELYLDAKGAYNLWGSELNALYLAEFSLREESDKPRFWF